MKKTGNFMKMGHDAPNVVKMAKVNGFPSLAGTPAPKKHMGGAKSSVEDVAAKQRKVERAQNPITAAPGKVDGQKRKGDVTHRGTGNSISGGAKTNGTNK